MVYIERKNIHAAPSLQLLVEYLRTFQKTTTNKKKCMVYVERKNIHAPPSLQLLVEYLRTFQKTTTNKKKCMVCVERKNIHAPPLWQLLVGICLPQCPLLWKDVNYCHK